MVTTVLRATDGLRQPVTGLMQGNETWREKTAEPIPPQAGGPDCMHSVPTQLNLPVCT